jgi:hypothetical protein
MLTTSLSTASFAAAASAAVGAAVATATTITSAATKASAFASAASIAASVTTDTARTASHTPPRAAGRSVALKYVRGRRGAPTERVPTGLSHAQCKHPHCNRCSVRHTLSTLTAVHCTCACDLQVRASMAPFSPRA